MYIVPTLLGSRYLTSIVICWSLVDSGKSLGQATIIYLFSKNNTITDTTRFSRNSLECIDTYRFNIERNIIMSRYHKNKKKRVNGYSSAVH